MTTREQVLVARLEQLRAFERLSPASLQELTRLSQSRTFDAGKTVTLEGEAASQVYIVLRGRVKMSRANASGGQALLALFGPGDVFGAVSALNGRVADASMVALEPTECLELRRQDLFALLGSSPARLQELLPLLSDQLVECRNCLVEAVASRVEVRFAHLFLKLGDKIGRPRGEALLVPVTLSRQDLADMVGTSLETSIRIMSRWGKTGVVETREDGFLLHDREALECLVRA